MVSTQPKTAKTVSLKRLHVDYEKLAEESGEEAYRSAKEAGLGEEVASTFRRVFGTPVEPEFRTS